MPEAAPVFAFTNAAAMLAWLPLALSLFVKPMRPWTWRITGIIVPAALAVFYVFSIAGGLTNGLTGGNFSSIEGIRTLFTDDYFLTAGWIHYLAFDLFVGTWIARSGTAAGIHPLLLLPCMALVLLAGPTGLLLYLLLRVVAGPRNWETLA